MLVCRFVNYHLQSLITKLGLEKGRNKCKLALHNLHEGNSKLITHLGRCPLDRQLAALDGGAVGGGEAEVRDLGLAVVCEEHVPGGEVAVHHVSGLEEGHAAARVPRPPDLVLLGDVLPAPAAEVLQ